MSCIDDYLAGIESEAFRASLQRLREIIMEEAPGAVECISYGIPTFTLGKAFVHFAAFKHHCSLFPGGIATDFADRLPGFKITTGTIQFTPERPIPEDVAREIVRASIARVAPS